MYLLTHQNPTTNSEQIPEQNLATNSGPGCCRQGLRGRRWGLPGGGKAGGRPADAAAAGGRIGLRQGGRGESGLRMDCGSKALENA